MNLLARLANGPEAECGACKFGSRPILPLQVQNDIRDHALGGWRGPAHASGLARPYESREHNSVPEASSGRGSEGKSKRHFCIVRIRIRNRTLNTLFD